MLLQQHLTACRLQGSHRPVRVIEAWHPGKLRGKMKAQALEAGNECTVKNATLGTQNSLTLGRIEDLEITRMTSHFRASEA